MITNKLLMMIARFLYGEYDANDFSYDFPDELIATYAELQIENNELAILLNDEMPDICAFFDPYDTGDPDTLDEKAFKEKVLAVYMKALPLTAVSKRAV